MPFGLSGDANGFGKSAFDAGRATVPVTLDPYISLGFMLGHGVADRGVPPCGGGTPVRTFIAGLPLGAKAEAIALIKLAETLGNNLREPHSKALGDGLFELRRNR